MYSMQQLFVNLPVVRLNLIRYVRKIRPNPGAIIQEKLINKDDLENDNHDIIGHTEDYYESDFMNIHRTRKQHQEEIRQHSENLKFQIIKRKYFNEKQPNFLTFSEKQQIKFLHTRDPNEWNTEKLVESFPADFETINKILKANWVPKSKKRIFIHDQKVLENWKLFKSGELFNLPPHLTEHLQKFTDRCIEDLKNLNIDFEENRFEVPRPEKTEFLDIVKKESRIDNEKKLLESKEKIRSDNSSIKNVRNEEETFIKGHITNKTPLRFRDLNLSSSQKSEDSVMNEEIVNFSAEEQEKKSDFPFSNSTDGKLITSNMNNIKKFDSNEIVLSESDMRKFDVSSIKEKIYIPKKIWKKDATYKVNDCYYDYDGEFLYRVPGMNK